MAAKQQDEKTDAEQTDAEQIDAEQIDAEQIDAEQIDAEQSDAEQSDDGSAIFWRARQARALEVADNETSKMVDPWDEEPVGPGLGEDDLDGFLNPDSDNRSRVDSLVSEEGIGAVARGFSGLNVDGALASALGSSLEMLEARAGRMSRYVRGRSAKLEMHATELGVRLRSEGLDRATKTIHTDLKQIHEAAGHFAKRKGFAAKALRNKAVEDVAHLSRALRRIEMAVKERSAGAPAETSKKSDS